MAHSGNPLTVTFDQLLANGSTTAYRPDITGQPVWTKSPSEFGRRVLNPAAFDYTFAIDGSGRAQGDEPRGYFSSPGLSEFEFSVKRQIKITEHVGLNYSAEFFNLFNHVNYAPPNTQWGQVYTDPITNNLAFSQNTNFGLIQSTLGDTTAGGGMFGVGGARSIQMALRLQF
jgi:hypothetical protein